MPAGETVHALDHELRGDRVHEIGEQHDQGAAVQAQRQLGQPEREVRLAGGVVEGRAEPLQALERADAGLRIAERAHPLVEGEETDAVPALE